MRFEYPSDRCFDMALLGESIEQHLQEQKKNFERQLIPDLRYLDESAHNTNGIEIQTVNYIKDNQFELVYRFDWHAYRGCSGFDESGTETSKVRFWIEEDGTIRFDLSIFGDSL